MEQIIIQQNQHWEKPYQDLVPRSILSKIMHQMQLKEIQVVLGPRRSGKSTLFMLIINELSQEVNPHEILYLNLDDPFYIEITKDVKKLVKAIETAQKLTQKKIKYLFLDEIQQVEFWEKYVKSVYDSQLFHKIFITGSNSNLLKGEYANLLSGRYILDMVYPYSFREILSQLKIKSMLELVENKVKLLRVIDQLLEYGSYPEIFKTKDNQLKRELILNYYDTILLKDCIAYGKIRDIKTFRELAHYLITNNGTLYSYLGLSKNINSNEGSVKDFIHYLENSYLFYELKHFSYSLKKQSKAKKKTYCLDNAFLANISFRFSSNKGKLFENLVFSELLKQGKTIYFDTEHNYECDFLVKEKKSNEFNLIQVCYELNSENQKREIKGLNKAGEQKNVSEKIIITYDQEEHIDDIKVIPFWKYFFIEK